MEVPPIFVFIARVLTFVFLLISLIVLVTTKNFSQIRAYSYMLFAIVTGLVYTLLHIALTIYHMTSGRNIGGNTLSQFEFYGDKVASHLLATAAAAGFGIKLCGINPAFESFLNKGNAAATILLIAFFFSAISSVFSSINLHKSLFSL